MNEQAIKDIVTDVVRKVLTEQCASSDREETMNAGPIPVEISARHVHLSVEDALSL